MKQLYSSLQLLECKSYQVCYCFSLSVIAKSGMLLHINQPLYSPSCQIATTKIHRACVVILARYK